MSAGPTTDLRRQGRQLLQARRAGQALAVIKAALAAEPDAADLHNDLGRACNNLGELRAAANAFNKAVKLDPGLVDAHANLGHVLYALGHRSEALEAYQSALSLDADHQRALSGLGVLHLGEGDPATAVDFFRRATTIRPGDARLWGQLGVAQQRAGDGEAAEAAYRKALELDEDDAELRLNHGITLQELDRLAEAIREYHAAARIAPGSPAIQNHLGNALLAAGDADGALDTTDRCLSLDPGNTAALSARVIALSRLGRTHEARELVDTELLVRQVEIKAPAGFDSMREFNRALADHVLADESLTFEPEGHATRKGGHTRDLLRGDKGPVEHLERIVMAAVEEYRGRLNLPDGHPFPGSLPATTRLAMWAVVMETEGHQLPHIHPAAWLSGVYYVSLPSSMGSGESDHDGWIEFGLPPEELQGSRLPDQVCFEPQEGRMFLFPSYFYHRTIPFQGNERRICIAFDVLRRQGRA